VDAPFSAESACGWCKDRWGFSWQITPRALNQASADPDPAVRKRVFEAMMTMRKIDVAKIEAARGAAEPQVCRLILPERSRLAALRAQDCLEDAHGGAGRQALEADGATIGLEKYGVWHGSPTRLTELSARSS